MNGVRMNNLYHILPPTPLPSPWPPPTINCCSHNRAIQESTEPRKAEKKAAIKSLICEESRGSVSAARVRGGYKIGGRGRGYQGPITDHTIHTLEHALK